MKNRQEPLKPPSPKRIVNVITGGDEVNGVTYTAAKKMSKVTVTHGKRVRQVLDEDNITFDDEDADGLLIPHNDALVLTDFVADFSTNLVPETEKELQGIDIIGPLPQAKGKSWQIKRITSAPYHPVANGQPESTNKVFINNLKKRLEESKGKRPEVLPGVLWAYRTTAKTSTDETPFSLVYGTEALIPVEIGEPSTRYTHATEELNEEDMRMNLDLLEERIEAVLIRMATQKYMIERYYNRKSNLRYFNIGDFVLKKVFQSTKAANVGKLSPIWEGPYRVRGIAGK
nr:uncharacterized protein LOC104092908 [Nicotiana tomentosiformis]